MTPAIIERAPHGASLALPGTSPSETPDPIFVIARKPARYVLWSDYVGLFHPPESGAVCVMAYQEEVAKGDYRTRQAGAKGFEVDATVRARRPRFFTLCGFRETVPAWARRKDKTYHEVPCKAEWNLSSLGSVWIELDYYKKPRLKHLPAEVMAAMVLDRVAERDLPQPSMIVSSGKGLYGIWRHETLSPYGKHGALAIWKAVQKTLNDHFVDFGRDIAAMSPTTNLRVAGSRNADNTVRIIWPAFADQIGRHSFADLKAGILPYTPEQVRAHRKAKAVERAARKAAKAAREAAAVAAGEPPRPKVFKLNRSTFQHAVMRDLLELFEDRFQGQPVPPGSRDLWLYHLVCASAWLVDPAALRDEVRRLGPLCGLAPRRAVVLMGSVLRNADRAAAGKTRSHRGTAGCDYRYRTNPRRIVEEFDVTVEDAERLDLRVLVPRALKAARMTERAAAYRKRKGATPRTEIQAERIAFGQWALEQHAAGVSVDELAFQAKARFVKHGSKSWVEKAMREARGVVIGKPQRKGVPGRPRKVPVEAAAAPEKNPYGSSRSMGGLDKSAAPVVAGKRSSYDDGVKTVHLTITGEARAALSRDKAALDVPEGCDPLHLGQYVLTNGVWYRWDFERQTSYPVHAGEVQYEEHNILGVPLDQPLHDAWQAELERWCWETIDKVVAEREAAEAAAPAFEEVSA